MNTQNTSTMMDKLNDYQLYEIYISPIDWSIKLAFTFGYNSKDIVVNLYNIIHTCFSKSFQDNDGNYLVYEANLNQINDGGKEILSLLNYPIKNSEGEVFSYPSQSLFHFHIEGDVCIDIICGDYKVDEIESVSE